MEQKMENPPVRSAVGAEHGDLTPAATRSIAALLGLDAEEISPDTRLFEDLSLDSTSVLEVLMQLEADLGIEFDPETLEPADFQTVRTLLAYVAKQAES
jgi:acyl carrier protein